MTFSRWPSRRLGSHSTSLRTWPKAPTPGRSRTALLEVVWNRSQAPFSEYLAADPDQRTVVLKIHGFVDRRSDSPSDSFVITEDHYISYLTRLDLDKLLPLRILGRLKNCHLLFLGYSLSDWNLRAMLYELSSEQLSADGHLNRKWWAILRDPSRTEVESWRRRGVDLFDVPLENWVSGLSEAVGKALET